MKKCEHFKDLILTDYMDGRMDKESAAGIESHLLVCSDCLAFLKEVKSLAVLPFHQDLHQTPPAGLWEKVRQGIERKEQVPHPFEGFIAHLKGLTVFPRMVPVFASLALMLLAGSMSLNTIQVQQAREKDQGEYLVSMVVPTSVIAPSENNDPGTPIESYFL